MNLSSLFILFLWMCTGVHAQWREDFSLEPFQAHAPWKGDLSYWTQEQGWLKSQGPAVSGTCIRLERAITSDTDFELRFLAHLMFATSSNNYLEMELEDSLSKSSIVIVLGGTPDEVSVFFRRQGSDSLLIDGVDKRLGSSSNLIAVRLRQITRSITLDLGIQGDTNSWVTEGKGSLKEIHPQTLRVRACYSASNAAKFFLDAIYFGVPDIDTLIPGLVSVYDVDSVNWHLEWSEGMDTTKGRIKDVNEIDVAFSWVNTREMRCDVKANTGLPVSLSGFEDASGNPSADTALALRFVPYSFREIQITEIFPDPSPPAGLPEVEWLELYNAGSQRRQLKNFKLADLSASFVFPEIELDPGAFLIITAVGNCSLLASYGDCLELGFSSSFLNNSGDRLFLQNRQGDTLEWLEYSDQWHDDVLKRNGGYSLEKKDPLNKCLKEEENFATSAALTGGTPGQVNSMDERIYDTIAPFVLNFELIGPSRMDVVFNESIDADKANFFFQGDSLPLTQTGPALYRINLPFLLPDNARLEYHGTLIHLQDCEGNTNNQALIFRYAIPVIPAPHELIFTELHFRPNVGQAGFIEVYNRGNKAQSLAGTAVIYEEKAFFPGKRLLYPSEALILCKEADTPYFSGMPYLAVKAMPVLNSKSGHLALKNVNGALLDAVHYSDSQFQSWPQKAMGYSLQRMDSTRACSYPGDWKASAVYGGEPGVHRFIVVYNDPIIPRLQEIYPESKRHLRLRFSAPIETDQPEIRLLEAWGSPVNWDLVSNDFRSWLLEWSDSLMSGQLYRVEISGLGGCNGEIMPKQELDIRLPERAAAIRINEILTDPIGDDPDYVELYNAGAEAVDLKGMTLCNLNADGSLKEQFPISTGGYLLMPGAYVVLTEAHHRLYSLYNFYDESRVRIMKDLPSFPNTEGAVVVLDSFGNVLDSFHYSDMFHSPILLNTEGVSLERINPDVTTDQSNNWTSASASSNFGTPGRKNSQSRDIPASGEKYWKLVSPTFSPDGDGFEDLALLVYDKLEPGSHVSINVFNPGGQQVCEWTNNLPCGSSGTLKWEGYDALGQPLPEGPYVISIVWTNPHGRSKRERLVLVKAAPLNDQ
ncbi:MAG: lamin tail domain-containing protein [Bacteroidia bacterium]